jgi:transcriptional regulator with XRE-family HTH domain
MQVFYTDSTKYILPIHSSLLQMTEGERIKKIRGTMKYAEFAEPLGVGASNISNIEKGRSGLSIDLAKKIAMVYNVSLDWLLLGMDRIVSEPTPEYKDNTSVVIDKDELIELQRLALMNTQELLKRKEENNEVLKNN